MAKITEKLTKKVIVEFANTIALDEAALAIFENTVKEKQTLVKLREALADPKRYRFVKMYAERLLKIRPFTIKERKEFVFCRCTVDMVRIIVYNTNKSTLQLSC